MSCIADDQAIGESVRVSIWRCPEVVLDLFSRQVSVSALDVHFFRAANLELPCCFKPSILSIYTPCANTIEVLKPRV